LPRKPTRRTCREGLLQPRRGTFDPFPPISAVWCVEELLPTAIVGGARPVKKQTTPRGPSPMETSAIECKVEAGAVTEEGIPGTDETITGPHDATIVAASNKASIAHLMAVV
jgi:hypothetical protein